MKFYHVAAADYTQGEDLLCWDEMAARGWVEPSDWKWDAERTIAEDGSVTVEPIYLDTEVVCMFRSLDEEREFAAEYVAGGLVLSIEVPEDVTIITVDEGYPAILNRIPARWVTVL